MHKTFWKPPSKRRRDLFSPYSRQNSNSKYENFDKKSFCRTDINKDNAGFPNFGLNTWAPGISRCIRSLAAATSWSPFRQTVSRRIVFWSKWNCVQWLEMRHLAESIVQNCCQFSLELPIEKKLNYLVAFAFEIIGFKCRFFRSSRCVEFKHVEMCFRNRSVQILFQLVSRSKSVCLPGLLKYYLKKKKKKRQRRKNYEQKISLPIDSGTDRLQARGFATPPAQQTVQRLKKYLYWSDDVDLLH